MAEEREDANEAYVWLSHEAVAMGCACIAGAMALPLQQWMSVCRYGMGSAQSPNPRGLYGVRGWMMAGLLTLPLPEVFPAWRRGATRDP